MSSAWLNLVTKFSYYFKVTSIVWTNRFWTKIILLVFTFRVQCWLCRRSIYVSYAIQGYKETYVPFACPSCALESGNISKCYAVEQEILLSDPKRRNARRAASTHCPFLVGGGGGYPYPGWWEGVPLSWPVVPLPHLPATVPWTGLLTGLVTGP